MARIITKELAEKIVSKLDAKLSRGKGPHDLALIFHEGKMVASFGIRRGSEKDKGHDHVPRDIHLSPHKARLLGQCPLSRDQWIEILREKNLL